MKNLIVSISLLLTSLSAPAAVFGIDDRLPARLTAPPGTIAALSRSTAVAVLSANFSTNANGTIKLETGSMNDVVCRDQKFSNDPSLAYACSGFLVGPDLIATAGHCMVNVGESRHETKTYCEAFSWLFDFAADASGQTKLDNISADNLYACQEVVYAIREERAPYRDYALVRLKRPVVGRQPLKLASSGPSVGETGLSMIGYPFGTPAKISIRGQVLLNDPTRESFITNLDAFEGNSGSAVFNQVQEVIGILISGAPSNSLIDAKANSCQIYNRCDEKGGNCTLPDSDTTLFPGYQGVGSEVQRIQPLRELIRSAL